jgi:hypothetical protein
MDEQAKAEDARIKVLLEGWRTLSADTIFPPFLRTTSGTW